MTFPLECHTGHLLVLVGKLYPCRGGQPCLSSSASGLRTIAGEALSVGVGVSVNQVLNDSRWDGLPHSEMRP